MAEKVILDACCGSRMFYFDKNDERVLFNDLHPRQSILCDGRSLVVEPDTTEDFTDMSFPDESFSLVVFDPPHLISGSGWQVEKYGKIGKEWEEVLTKGFAECFRVLKQDGVLVFKWNEFSVPLKDVLKCTDIKPIFGNKRPGQSKTHWLCFMKPKAEENDGESRNTDAM